MVITKLMLNFHYTELCRLIFALWGRFFQLLSHFLVSFLESVSGCPCVFAGFGRQEALGSSSLGRHRRRGMVVVGQGLQHCWISLEIKMDRLIICQPCHFFRCNFFNSVISIWAFCWKMLKNFQLWQVTCSLKFPNLSFFVWTQSTVQQNCS